MFDVKKEKFEKFTKLTLFNKKTNESISVIPEFGAKIKELVLRKGKSYSLLEGDKKEKELLKERWFRGSQLIPFPNRVSCGRYSFEGKNYQLPINFPSQNHAIHGLVYNKKFLIKNIVITKSKAEVTLFYEAKNLKGYPFRFSVELTYILRKNEFLCKTKIKNLDLKKIPIGNGFHPYLTFQRKVDEILIKIPKGDEILVDERGIPINKTSYFGKFRELSKISKTLFDTCFKLDDKEKFSKTIIYEPRDKVTLEVWQKRGKNGYNYLQVFIPPKRKSIAVEPMTCSPDAFNNGDGLIVLKPKEIFKGILGIKIK